jgi:hypothetical protein
LHNRAVRADPPKHNQAGRKTALNCFADKK